MPKSLGEFEQAVLMAIVRLQDDAYGATIGRDIEERTGRSVAIGAIYTTLGRLLANRLVRATVGEPTPERGGRRKKYYRLSRLGEQALARSYEMQKQMAAGIERQLAALAASHRRGAS